MNGYEVARTLRSETGLRSALLVAITGYGQEADRRRSAEAGFDFHLTKPVNLDELRAILSGYGRGVRTASNGDEACQSFLG